MKNEKRKKTSGILERKTYLDRGDFSHVVLGILAHLVPGF